MLDLRGEGSHLRGCILPVQSVTQLSGNSLNGNPQDGTCNIGRSPPNKEEEGRLSTKSAPVTR